MQFKISSSKWQPFWLGHKMLTHWGRVTHICVSIPTTTGSDNGLSLDRRQAIIRTNARILLRGTLGTNFSGILMKIQNFSFKKMHFKMSSAKCGPFYLVLNVLNTPVIMMLRNDIFPRTSLSALILGLRQTNERRCYNVTPSLIGWAQI